MIAPAFISSLIPLIIFSNCPSGVASNIRSASFIPSAGKVEYSSIIPSPAAFFRLSIFRPMPDIFPLKPCFLTARAKDPPRRPTPIIAIFLNSISLFHKKRVRVKKLIIFEAHAKVSDKSLLPSYPRRRVSRTLCLLKNTGFLTKTSGMTNKAFFKRLI